MKPYILSSTIVFSILLSTLPSYAMSSGEEDDFSDKTHQFSVSSTSISASENEEITLDLQRKFISELLGFFTKYSLPTEVRKLCLQTCIIPCWKEDFKDFSQSILNKAILIPIATEYQQRKLPNLRTIKLENAWCFFEKPQPHNTSDSVIIYGAAYKRKTVYIMEDYRPLIRSLVYSHFGLNTIVTFPEENSFLIKLPDSNSQAGANSISGSPLKSSH